MHYNMAAVCLQLKRINLIVLAEFKTVMLELVQATIGKPHVTIPSDLVSTSQFCKYLRVRGHPRRILTRQGCGTRTLPDLGLLCQIELTHWQPIQPFH